MSDSALPFLDGYSGETTDELLARDGEVRTDSLVLAFEAGLIQKIERGSHPGLSKEEKTVLAVSALEREVNNGGYEQFFLNDSCEFAPIIVDALKAIGAARAAELTQTVIAMLKVKNLDRAEDYEAAAEMIDPECFEPHDQVYYDNVGDLADPLLAFIRKERAAIKLP